MNDDAASPRDRAHDERARGSRESASAFVSDAGITQVRDVPVDPAVTDRQILANGAIFDVVQETFTLPGGEKVTRQFIQHPGAVGILALDRHDRVLIQRQRRQPVRQELWEIPAGLMDMAGESPLETAKRELYEEADLRAEEWDVLVDLYNSPGSSSEAIRVFLARDLSSVSGDERFNRTEEEAGMPRAWVSLEEAVDAVLEGRLGNPTTVAGILALQAFQSRGYEGLRPADAPWPGRPQPRDRMA